MSLFLAFVADVWLTNGTLVVMRDPAILVLFRELSVETETLPFVSPHIEV